MIIVQFSGGLGNQLSQYGLYMEYKARGYQTYADLSWYGNAQPKDGKVDTRKLELPHLGINLDMCPEKYSYYGHEEGYSRYLRRIMVGPVYFEKDYKFTLASDTQLYTLTLREHTYDGSAETGHHPTHDVASIGAAAKSNQVTHAAKIQRLNVVDTGKILAVGIRLLVVVGHEVQLYNTLWYCHSLFSFLC